MTGFPAASSSIDDMLALGRTIAELHQRSPVASAGAEFGSVSAICEPAIDNFKTLEIAALKVRRAIQCAID